MPIFPASSPGLNNGALNMAGLGDSAAETIAGYKLEEAEARSKMSPYALGVADHRALREAIEMHGSPYIRRTYVLLLTALPIRQNTTAAGRDALPLRP